MRVFFSLCSAAVLSVALAGCDTKTTMSKTEHTVQTPDGTQKATVEQKVEKTDESTTRTTVEKVEKTGDNPPVNNP